MKPPKLVFPLILAMFTLLLFSTCKKDDNSDNQADPWSLVLEETIGPAGGLLSDESFSLEIPAGVFNSSYTLSLYSSSNKVYGDQQVAPSFEIRGLPEEFEGTLPISIKASRPVEDEFFVIAGALSDYRSSHDTAYAVKYLPAVDSSGFIRSSIVSVMSGRDDNPPLIFRKFLKGKFFISAVDAQGRYESSHGMFIITFPVAGIQLSDAESLGEALETAVNKFGELKFDTAQIRSSYPIQVSFRPFKGFNLPLYGWLGDNEDLYGVYSTSGWYFSPSFQFNSTKLLQKRNTLAANAGHECFHMIQSLYRTNGELKNWLVEATATYTEEFFFIDGAYVPDEFNSHWYRPLVGMESGATFYDPSEKKVSSAFHGYGMSVIIKYFINHAKVQNPLKVMIESLHNGVHPVEAVFSVVPGEDFSSTWEAAMYNYVSKTTYPMDGLNRAFIAGDLYTPMNWAKAVTLKADETVFPSVTFNLPDLSATFVNITLEGNFSPEQVLDVNITTTGDIGHILYKPYYYIFKENGTETPFLEVPATGTEKLQSLKANNYRIAVLLTNSRHEHPYTGKTEVTVELRIYGQPIVQTDEASDVTGSSANLNAKINPSGTPTTGYFEYGLTEAYGNSIPLSQSQMSGFQLIQVSATVTGLQPNKTYHYRIVATNSSGKTEGNNLTFETGDAGQIAIGSNYQGGIIFYLEPGGLHGLIAAPFDQAHAPWGCYGTFIECTDKEIGTGQANTTLIVNMCGEGTAASICDDLELNGYNDWFLPSYLELKEICKVDAIGGFEPILYWSSTEAYSNYAVSVYMETGEGNNNQPKFNDAIRVRAIRAF